MAKIDFSGLVNSQVNNPELTGAGSVGVNLHEIQYLTRRPALRARIGDRSRFDESTLYKPGFTKLSNGDLLVCPCSSIYDENSKLKSMPILVFRSKDEGITWTRVETKGDPLLGKEPALQELSDGRLILIASHPHGFRISRSDDGGVSWKTIQLGPYCEDDEMMKYEEGAFEYGVIRNVLEENDGSLSAWMIKYNTEDWKKFFRKEIGFLDVHSEACLFISRDRGDSWEETGRKFNWCDLFGTWFEELQVMRHSDGRLMAFMRVGWDHQLAGIPVRKDIRTYCGEEIGDHMMLMESSDNGVNWSGPRAVTNYGEPHGHLLELTDGRILCTYVHYHLPYGIYAILSKDGGRTWDTQHPVQLALSLTGYMGWPTSVQLPCGDIVTAYALTAYEWDGKSPKNNFQMVCESIRWQLPPEK